MSPTSRRCGMLLRPCLRTYWCEDRDMLTTEHAALCMGWDKCLSSSHDVTSSNFRDKGECCSCHDAHWCLLLSSAGHVRPQRSVQLNQPYCSHDSVHHLRVHCQHHAAGECLHPAGLWCSPGSSAWGAIKKLVVGIGLWLPVSCVFPLHLPMLLLLAVPSCSSTLQVLSRPSAPPACHLHVPPPCTPHAPAEHHDCHHGALL